MFRPCNKFKGTLVSAVGWAQGQVTIIILITRTCTKHKAYNPFINFKCSTMICYVKVGASTGPLLAGTTLGLIIEAELTSDERFFSMGGVEEHFRF